MKRTVGILVMITLIMFLCLEHRGLVECHIPFTVPTNMLKYTCKASPNRFEPRCYSARYYYSIESAEFQHSQDCDSAAEKDEINRQILELCKKGITDTAEAEKCDLPVIASNQGEYLSGNMARFKDRGDKWMLTKKLKPNGEIYWVQEGADIEKLDIELREMKDEFSLPNGCAQIYSLIDKPGFAPKDTLSTHPVSPALDLELPPCGDYSTWQTVPKHAFRRDKVCTTPNEVMCSGDPSDLCINIIYMIPVITTDVKQSKFNCLPTELIEDFKTCKITEKKEVMAPALRDSLTKQPLPEITIEPPNPARSEAEADMEEMKKSYRCNSALYHYGVVAAELHCDGSCAETTPTGKCKADAVKQICGEEECKLTVRVHVLADYEDGKDGEDKSVPWHMKWEDDKGLYHKIWGNKQYIYTVKDEKVGEENCAVLAIDIKNRKAAYDLANLPNEPAYDDVASSKPVPLPMPWWEKKGLDALGAFQAIDDVIDTGRKCGTTGKIGVKVKLIFLFDELYDKSSNKACKKTDIVSCNAVTTLAKLKPGAKAAARKITGNTEITEIKDGTQERFAYRKKEYVKVTVGTGEVGTSKRKKCLEKLGHAGCAHPNVVWPE